MYENYAHVLIFALVAALIVLAPLILFALFRPVRPDAEKLSAYECGERVVGTPWIQFNIRYYLVCLVFLVFEVEILLLFPWALVYGAFIAGPEQVEQLTQGAANTSEVSGGMAFIAMFIFMVVLAVGLAYDWGKGYLEWETEVTTSPEIEEKEVA
ncbi:MAG: NADH-quinone oxidoreductase subunit A [Candidatus Omnitrophica bacterium]|nr:NADH-quinone oxidoreductase subunit A [Candidatus Omnitrophota bacterium]MCB9783687.1 NADH-quinone oxidoreductase subunit A [Candidatus Omnitrophota bacterium]